MSNEILLEQALADLSHSDKWTRATAIKTLVALNARVAIPRLIDLLRDPEPLVRVTAAEALGMLGAAEAIPAVEALLTDEARSWLTYGERVGEVAAAALERLRSAESRSPSAPAPEDLFTWTEAPAVEQSTSPPDFEKMSPEALMTWMESLPKRQGASEAYVTGANLDTPEPDYLPAELPDWLRESVVPSTLAEAADVDDDEATSDIPDWLQDTIDLASEAPAPPAPSITPPKPSRFVRPDSSPPSPSPLSGTPTRFRPAASSSPPATDPAPLKQARFSAYFPHQIETDRRYSLLVYAHTEQAAAQVDQDAGNFRDELGGDVPPPMQASQQIALPAGTPLTIIPECEGLTFDPPLLTKRWDGEWTRGAFDFHVGKTSDDEPLLVRVAVLIEGIEIAHIRCTIQVQNAGANETNALAAAKLQSQTAQMYQQIFVSYAREDAAVAEAYRFAQIAAGHEVFMDSYSIRSGGRDGENWKAALARAIDQADVFQLFWSARSANSPHVREEWRYALLYKCPETLCEGFIRPVYWQKPLIEPPGELRHLNFRYVNFQSS